ncbi:MAG: DsbA family oxidoreductase [Proteobacteria bacterium]|jgi:predicted DsbA family dithiol-disulfide isomerase|nr:DsbA family oxidoreductase [Pseudomonadota bacterium]
MYLDIVSDLICPWCFIGKRRLDEVLATPAGAGVVPRWRPFQLYPNLPMDGIDRATFMRARFGEEGARRGTPQALLDEARSVGLELNYAAAKRVPNTLNGHRLVDWIGPGAAQHALMDTLFRYYFCEGRDIGDNAVLADAAAAIGTDRDAALAMLNSDAGIGEVHALVRDAYDSGVTGVPCFVLPNGYAIPGAQPTAVLVRLIERARELEQAASVS